LAEADDRAIWDFARDKGFTIVSLDADFAERAALSGPPHIELIGTFERDAAARLEIY
jgi:predicted nuclease of predicted toxin-antitoxin system